MTPRNPIEAAPERRKGEWLADEYGQKWVVVDSYPTGVYICDGEHPNFLWVKHGDLASWTVTEAAE